MLTHERQRQVLRQMRTHGIVNVADLARAVGASPSTIRRDLKDMDRQGLLVRVHGGANLVDNGPESARLTRAGEHEQAKEAIGQAAAAMVRDHSTILVYGGTTTELMLPYLEQRTGLTVLTNGLGVALELSRLSDITVVVLGGILRSSELSLLGPLTERAREDFSVDTAFVGAFGIDARTGVTGASVHEAGTSSRLFAGVDSLVVLADSSKFARRGPVRIARVDQVAALVTDSGAPAAEVETLRAAGVDVHCV